MSLSWDSKGGDVLSGIDSLTDGANPFVAGLPHLLQTQLSSLLVSVAWTRPKKPIPVGRTTVTPLWQETQYPAERVWLAISPPLIEMGVTFA